MKKTEKFDYLIFAGKTKDDLRPACAYKFKEDAIEAAERLKATKVFKFIEVTYMPEDDDDTNEIIWTSYKRRT